LPVGARPVEAVLRYRALGFLNIVEILANRRTNTATSGPYPVYSQQARRLAIRKCKIELRELRESATRAAAGERQ